jgi:hypothetical protein
VEVSERSTRSPLADGGRPIGNREALSISLRIEDWRTPVPLIHVTPTDTTELFEPTPTPRRPEPGDQLASYPDAPEKGEEAAGPFSGADGPIVLSGPIAADDLAADTPYVVRDESGRVLCLNNAGFGVWEWAYFGDYETYTKDVSPVYFSANPASSTSPLVANVGDAVPVPMQLYANGTATSWEWAFWGRGYSSSQLLRFSARPGGANSYVLQWNNAGTVMSLCADSGSWNWAYVSSSKSSLFTFHKFYVDRSKADDLVKATWPGSIFTYVDFKPGDAFYEAVPDSLASDIYAKSGLSAYRWRSEVFDCDDFSYVYKAEASRSAYASNAEYGYAIGVIFGSAPSGGHAVNVFIDPKGTVRVIEPQSGRIEAGKSWKDVNGAPYSPYFVLM